jgi:hypothetical protein
MVPSIEVEVPLLNRRPVVRRRLGPLTFGAPCTGETAVVFAWHRIEGVTR